MITLGIETSCDETAIALLDDGKLRANAVYSQWEHAGYGGVVPEIASRAHLEKIAPLASAAMHEAGLGTGDVDLIAVTDSPGLAGALLVGISFALGLHVRHAVPVCGINHLEGHIAALGLSHPELQPPFLALVVSGGHTALFRVDGIGRYACLGQTVDDAAGEAFDKVGKLLGFPYPAGRLIEAEAAAAGPAGCAAGPIEFPVAKFPEPSLDFSFSGLKTAVKYFVEEKGADFAAGNRPAVCRAFQEAAVASLVNNCCTAVSRTGLRTVAVVGGVACNGRLREALRQRLGANVVFPPAGLCVDNGAMIASAGYQRAQKNMLRPPHMDPGGAL